MLKGLEISVVKKSFLNTDLRYEAQFFQKRYLDEDNALLRHELSVIGSFAFVTDGPHGYHEVDEKSSIAMLTAKCASDWFADREGADTIAKWVEDANKRSSLVTNDIILSTRGTVGNCALVVPESLPANIDQDVARIAIAARSNMLPSFVIAYLNCRFGQDHILRNASGMVQQGLSLTKVRDIPVPALSNQLQLAISEQVNSALMLRREAASGIENAEHTLLSALGLADWAPPEPLSYSAKFSALSASARLDAQYYMPAKTTVRNQLALLPGQVLGKRFCSVREMFDPNEASTAASVRNFDLSDALQPVFEDYHAPVDSVTLGSVKKKLKNGDVVISRLRSYLREIAVVRTSDAAPSIGSSEFFVLRPRAPRTNKISPETLMVFLRSAPVQTILKWCQDGSQHPRFSESDLLSIPLPDAVENASNQIEAMVKQSFAARRESRDLLDRAKRAVEIAIEQNEAAALAYLSAP